VAKINSDTVGDWQGNEDEAAEAWNCSACSDLEDRDDHERAWQLFCERAGADPAEWHELLARIAREVNGTHQIVIISGEGSGEGTRELYTDTVTRSALNARLRKERCGGDRWARIEVDGQRAWDADQLIASDEELAAVIGDAAL
jgi:hypothetical protein